MSGPTYVSTVLTEQVVIKLGNGDGPPETFTAPMSFNADRALEMTANATAVEVPQAGNAGPMKTMRHVVSTDSKITGAGSLAIGDMKTWADWLLSGLPKNVEFINPSTGLTLTGSYVITQLTETGSKQGDLVTVQVTLEQADVPTTSVTA